MAYIQTRRKFAGPVCSVGGFEVGPKDNPVQVIDSDGKIAIASMPSAVAAPIILDGDTPVNNVKATGTITFSAPVVDRGSVTIGSEVYEMSTDGVPASEDYLIVDISSGTKIQATGTLTLLGVTKDGETITVGDTIFEIDTDGVVATGNTAIDLSASAVAATGTLTLSGPVSNGETVTIGADVYEFTTDGIIAETSTIAVNVAGDLTAPVAVAALVIAADLAGTENVTVTNGDLDTVVVTHNTPGTIGNSVAVATDCATGDWGVGVVALAGGSDAAAPASVTAITAAIATIPGLSAADGANDTVVVTATAGGDLDGSAGNLVVTETDCANGSFGAARLAGGTDATGIEAATALAASITANSAIVDAVQGADANTNKVTVTAKEAGADGNYATTTDLTDSAAWGAATLTGGSIGTEGVVGSIAFDDNFIYVCVDVTDGVPTWKKSSLSSL